MLGKIRRNSLINLVQLMQRITNPIPMVKVGQDVLPIIKNGEISRAIKGLNMKSTQDRRVALMVSQAVQASRETKTQLNQVALTMNAYNDPKRAALFNWILKAEGDGTWQEKLLASLLFKEASRDFHEIIVEFLTKNDSKDSFFMVLKTWKNFADSMVGIAASKIGNPDDHLPHWLVALVERMYLLSRGHDQPDPRFDELSVKLSQQFLREHMNGSDQLRKSLLVLLFTDAKV